MVLFKVQLAGVTERILLAELVTLVLVTVTGKLVTPVDPDKVTIAVIVFP